MNKNKLKIIFNLFATQTPMPQTELFSTNDFTFLMAVILSAQATDKSVNKVTSVCQDKINTPQKIVALGQENFAKTIKSINIYKNKAKYIYELSKILIEKFDSKVPLTFDELIKLPGVGQKTANVVLNVLCNEGKIAVDTHVFRVAQRIGIAKSKTPTDLEEKLYKTIPKEYWVNTNHWLVLHGRYICKARKPLCKDCFLNEYCEYFNKINQNCHKIVVQLH